MSVVNGGNAVAAKNLYQEINQTLKLDGTDETHPYTRDLLKKVTEQALADLEEEAKLGHQKDLLDVIRKVRRFKRGPMSDDTKMGLKLQAVMGSRMSRRHRIARAIMANEGPATQAYEPKSTVSPGKGADPLKGLFDNFETGVRDLFTQVQKGQTQVKPSSDLSHPDELMEAWTFDPSTQKRQTPSNFPSREQFFGQPNPQGGVAFSPSRQIPSPYQQQQANPGQQTRAQ